MPGLALTEMNKVDLFLPSERSRPPEEDQQVQRELQGGTWFGRGENRVLWSRGGGGKTGIRGRDCHTEMGAGTPVLCGTAW